MTYQELLENAKIKVRKTSSDKLDVDLKMCIDAAMADMKRIGVNEEKHLKDVKDPLIISAIMAYVKAYYDMDKYNNRWVEAYNTAMCKIKGGDYK